MKNGISAALDGLYSACIWIAGLALLVMSLIIPVGVFARYLLGTGAQWPEPIAILMMVVFTFFGAAAAYRAGAHIAVAMFTDRLDEGLRRGLAIGVDLLMLAVSGFVLVWGLRLCAVTWGQTLAELPWMPVGVTYLPLPLGGAITLLFVLERMVFGPQTQRPGVGFDDATTEATAEATTEATADAVEGAR